MSVEAPMKETTVDDVRLSIRIKLGEACAWEAAAVDAEEKAKQFRSMARDKTLDADELQARLDAGEFSNLETTVDICTDTALGKRAVLSVTDVYDFCDASDGAKAWLDERLAGAQFTDPSFLAARNQLFDHSE